MMSANPVDAVVDRAPGNDRVDEPVHASTAHCGGASAHIAPNTSRLSAMPQPPGITSTISPSEPDRQERLVGFGDLCETEATAEKCGA